MWKRVCFLSFLVMASISCGSNHDKVSSCGELTPVEQSEGIFTPEVLWKLGRIGEYALSPDGKTIVYSVTKYNLESNKGNTSLWTVSVDGGQAQCIASGEKSYSNPRWNKTKSTIGYIYDGQIWEMNADGSHSRQLTDIDGGVNGFEFSPRGDKLFYLKNVKIDPMPIDIYPDLPLAEVHIAESLGYRHWDYWSDGTYSHVFVADLATKKIVKGLDILDGEPYDSPLSPYFDQSEVTWSPDGSMIAYTCKKVSGNETMISTNSDIYVYNVDNGKIVNVSEGMMGYDRYPVFSPDCSKVAFQSMATPMYESDKERIMVVDLNSLEATDLSADFDQTSSNFVWNEDGSKMYFTSIVQGTIHVYEVELASKSIRKITNGDYDYSSIVYAGDYLYAARNSMRDAVELYRIDKSNGQAVQITSVNNSIYDVIQRCTVEGRWIEATDGAQIWTWVALPPNFDPNKKYPALLFCEGGPQSPVSQFFSYRWNIQLMASQGYIVVAPNRRGLPGFGQAWNDQIAGDYGGQNMDDYLSAIDALAKEPYVDETRLGCVGASYGGYSVFWLAGHHNKRFKAFISHCGIFNLESQYAATEEVWFVNHDLEGAYWENPRPKSYDKFSPHLYVQNWDTPILIISGEKDFRISYSESLQAFNSAQLRGIPSKLLIFPTESHWVVKPQNSILWQREYFHWLDCWLK